MKRKMNAMSEREMRSFTDGYNNFLTMVEHWDIDPYKKLALSIIRVAADDYKMAIETNNTALREETESFFNSKHFEVLAGDDYALIRENLCLAGV